MHRKSSLCATLCDGNRQTEPEIHQVLMIESATEPDSS